MTKLAKFSNINKIKNFFFMILVFSLIFTGIYPVIQEEMQMTNVNDVNTKKTLKTSYFNNSLNPILIDGINANDWTWASGQPWCSGSGIWSDPYVIENVSINGNWIPGSAGIEIKNSNKFFRIKNCSIDNSYDAGIKFDNVTNGLLFNNTVHGSYLNGIYLINGNNNTILENSIFDNSVGIRLQNSENNTINGNNLNGNRDSEISLYSGSNNNTISENKIKNDGPIWNPYVGTSYSHYGIYLSSNEKNSIFKNNFTLCGLKIVGSLGQTTSHTIDTTNLINGNPVYYYTNEIGLGIDNFTYAGNVGQVILVNCSNSNVSNLNISSTSIGISLLHSNNNSILQNNASNNSEYGIYLYISDNNTISENTLNNNSNGLYSQYSDSNNISKNILKDNEHGIYLSSNYYNELTENSMTRCGIYVSGSIEHYSSNTIDTTNLVNERPLYYYVNETDLGNNNFTNGGQVILAYCNNSKISGLNLSYTSIGISLRYSYNNTISNNDASYNNDNGIELSYCYNTTVSGNNVSNNNNYGIYVYYSNNNTISENTVSDTGKYKIYLSVNNRGLYLYQSHNNSVSGNTVNNNGRGIFVSSSENNIVSGNTANNNDYGIYVFGENTNVSENTANYNNYGINIYGSNDGKVIGNNVSNNNYNGIVITNSHNIAFSGNSVFSNNYGIQLDSNSDGNIFWLNYISDNVNSQAEDDGTNNWDNDTVGNYWGDYTEKYPSATNLGGIWDTNYTISGSSGSIDRYPLTDYPFEGYYPIANFTVNATKIFVWESVQFTDFSIGRDLPLNYQWNFGDGSSNSTELNPSHTFSELGTFLVTLTVTDADGDISVFSYLITVVKASLFPQELLIGMVVAIVGVVIIFSLVIIKKRKSKRTIADQALVQSSEEQPFEITSEKKRAEEMVISEVSKSFEEEQLRKWEEERLQKEEEELLRKEEKQRKKEEERQKKREEDRLRKEEKEQLRREAQESQKQLREEQQRKREEARLKRLEEERLSKEEQERLRKEEIERIRTEKIEKITNLFDLSDRVRIQDVVVHMKMTKPDLIQFLTANREAMGGIKIDGDFIKVTEIPTSVEKPIKATLPKTDIEGSLINVSRGFEVAGDVFRFFIRIENVSNFAITDVFVRISLPHTLRLDKKSPSVVFQLGDIRSKKYATATYFLFCDTCADTDINAYIQFKDAKADLKSEIMKPFEIVSCKYIKPRQISGEEFDEIYEKEQKKTIEISLKDDITEQDAIQAIRDRMTMNTVSLSSNSLEMSGTTRDNYDVLLKTMIKEIQGVKTLVATVGTSNQNVQMGALSDIMEAVVDLRMDTSERFDFIDFELDRQNIMQKLDMFIDKPDDLEHYLRRIITDPNWNEEKIERWTDVIQEVLEDWITFKPSKWEKIGKSILYILSNFITDEVTDLVSGGVRKLFNWIKRKTS